MRLTCWRGAQAAVGVLLLAAGVSGCADEKGGTPSAPGQSWSASGENQVPAVQEPLNAEAFLSRPCDLVGAQAVSAVGDTKPGEPDVDSEEAKNLTGPTCTWRTDSHNLWFYVAVDTVHREHAEEGLKGIGSIYAEKDNPRFVAFETPEIPGHPGYPAVIARTQTDVDEGVCAVRVGVANDLIFIVDVTNKNDLNAACPSAVNVAASVLDTLKRGV